MIKRLRTTFALLAFAMAGCVPLVIEGDTRHFADSEYAFPLADGRYAVDGLSLHPAIIANRPDHVEITLTKNDEASTLIGGFVALTTPGYFIFQATDAMENGKPAEKKPGETTYIPVHIARSGEVSWYVGPKKHCDPECAALFSAHGFRQDGSDGDWHAPKNLSRALMLAFYEALVPLLERNPDAWEATRMMRVGGS